MQVWLPCNCPFFQSRTYFPQITRLKFVNHQPQRLQMKVSRYKPPFLWFKNTTTRPWPLSFLREFWGSPWFDETPSLALAMFAGSQDEDLRSLILCKSNRQLWQMQRISVQLKCQTPVMCCIHGEKKEWGAAARNLEERLMHSLKKVSYSYTN